MPQTDCIPRLPGRPWIWFDLDDTLWDFRGNSLIALDDVYRHFDLGRLWPHSTLWFDVYHRVNDELWQAYSRGEIQRDYLRMELFRRPLVSAGCTDAEARRLSTLMDSYYLGLLARMGTTVDGALPLLRRVHPSYNIGVLSNGFAEVQYGKMDSAALTPLIDCVVLSDEIEVNKPDSRIFDHACAKAHTCPEMCLMIGDNPDTDIAGAVGAGWKAIYFCPRADEANLLDFRARFPSVPTVASLSALSVADTAADARKTPFSGLIVKKST